MIPIRVRVENYCHKNRNAISSLIVFALHLIQYRVKISLNFDFIIKLGKIAFLISVNIWAFTVYRDNVYGNTRYTLPGNVGINLHIYRVILFCFCCYASTPACSKF